MGLKTKADADRSSIDSIVQKLRDESEESSRSLTERIMRQRSITQATERMARLAEYAADDGTHWERIDRFKTKLVHGQMYFIRRTQWDEKTRKQQPFGEPMLRMWHTESGWQGMIPHGTGMQIWV